MSVRRGFNPPCGLVKPAGFDGPRWKHRGLLLAQAIEPNSRRAGIEIMGRVQVFNEGEQDENGRESPAMRSREVAV